MHLLLVALEMPRRKVVCTGYQLGLRNPAAWVPVLPLLLIRTVNVRMDWQCLVTESTNVGWCCRQG